MPTHPVGPTPVANFFAKFPQVKGTLSTFYYRFLLACLCPQRTPFLQLRETENSVLTLSQNGKESKISNVSEAEMFQSQMYPLGRVSDLKSEIESDFKEVIP